ncbi:MAG: A/G-specific adenine glycosylase [Sphingomonadaceae bacterium]|nr:A/G-specific adenine glycosylase [Sphingomonadaceae bacterium]
MPSSMPHVQPADQKTGDIAALLLAHYDVHARDLPWRNRPGEGLPAPYHVWLSEIMLQQTTVAAVGPYSRKFTERWPDFSALAAADEADVMAAWAGLGYYARARNLIKCARAVAVGHGGQLPATEAGLLTLPGIGPYTAAAIAAIAFDQRAVVVDANVERVVSRLFAISIPLPAAKPIIREAADAITPGIRAGDFAQAMMDLGAGICSVKAPSCMLCPLQSHCDAFGLGNPEAYPVKAAKKAKPTRRGTAYWVEREGEVYLVTRQDKGMLGGMRSLPDDGWNSRTNGDGKAPFTASWQHLDNIVQHEFTHFTLSLRIAVTALGSDANPPGGGMWWPVKSLDKAGLPTLFTKVAKAVLASGER